MTLLKDPPMGATAEPAFIAYAQSVDVNWSDDLEALHEESSRDHFLDVCTRRALLDAVIDAVPANGVLLDAGCSTGYLLQDARCALPRATLIGVDLVPAGLRRAHESVPDARLLLADVCDLPLLDGVADAAVSANLLEHVPDDDGALAELHRALRPGGMAAIVVPAGPGTYDYYDRYLDHERRYGRRELANKARDVGFEVVRDAYLGSLIYPVFWAVKKRNRRAHPNPSPAETRALVERDIARTTDSRLGALTTRIERALLDRGIVVPFGIRSFTVLRRPS
jgi:SAM-dependent methyltransferase